MWLDVVGLFMLGLTALWGARAGLIRALAVLVAASVAIAAQSLFGAALGSFLASTLDVHPPWAAQLAGRTLTAFAGGAGVLALGTALGLVAPKTSVLGWTNRAAGLVAGLGLGMMAAAWLGTLIAGEPLLHELAGRSRLLVVGQKCLALSQRLTALLVHILGWPEGTG